MRKLIIFLFITITLSIKQITYASLSIEPIVGYSFGLSTLKNGTGESKLFYHGVDLSARVGWQYLGVNSGVEYAIKLPFKKILSSGPTINSDFSNINSRYLSAFVEYKFPLLFTGRARYIFIVQHELESGVGDGDIYSGDGFGLGVGFTGFPFIVINLDYRIYTLDSFEDATNSSESILSNGFNDQEFIISVGIPVNL